jgi:hypothetical protein
MGTTELNKQPELNEMTDLQRFKLLLEIPDYVITEFYSELKGGLMASLTMKIENELHKVSAIGSNVVELSARMNEAYRAILPFVKQRELRNDKLYN